MMQMKKVRKFRVIETTAQAAGSLKRFHERSAKTGSTLNCVQVIIQLQVLTYLIIGLTKYFPDTYHLIIGLTPRKTKPIFSNISG